MATPKKRIIVGISGATGAILGIRTVEELAKRRFEVHAVVTDAAWNVIRHEVSEDFKFAPGVRVDDEKNPYSPVLSSSFAAEAMVVAPCSMKTLAGIATGYAGTHLIRAADGMLRTGRRLIVVPRETPLSLADIENMAAVRRGGAIVMPPCVSYYHGPKTVADVTDFFVGKILDALGIENRLYRHWEGK